MGQLKIKKTVVFSLFGALVLSFNPSALFAEGKMGQSAYDQEGRAQMGIEDKRLEHDKRARFGEEVDERARFDVEHDQFARDARAGIKGEKLDRQTVTELQRNLNEEGYQVAVDGIWGPETQAAVRQYQQDEGLQATGRLDERTLASLGVDMDAGMRARMGIGEEAGFNGAQQLSSNQIRQMQQQLRNEGHQIAVDGVWGPETQQALRQYQQQEGLEATGQPDQRTLASLGVEEDARARFGDAPVGERVGDTHGIGGPYEGAEQQRGLDVF